jgi:DNA gyrase subunit B
MPKNIRKYNANSITVYSAIEGVRKSPAMYLGDIDSNGTLQCIKEILQNAVDETRECGGGKIVVKIKGKQIIVADEGRGIPIEIHSQTNKTTLETVMTHLHAGGKTGNKIAYGKNVIGIHGVGASVVNALSNSFCVWSYRVKKWWRIDFERGIVVKKIYQSKPPFKWSKGTIVSFRIDDSIIKSPLNLLHVRQMCSLVRYFSPVDIDYSDDEKSYFMVRKEPENLLHSFIKKENLENFIEPISINVNEVRVVACWTNATDTKIDAYVSGAPVASGTHVQGLEQGLINAIQNVANRDSKKCSNPLIGLRAVLDVSVDQPSFSGQNKTKLLTASVRKQVIEAIVKPVIAALKKQKDGVSQMLAHATRIAEIDAHSATMKKVAKIADTKSKLSFPKGFIAALSFPPERRECFLVEGKSAGGCFLGSTKIMLANGNIETLENLVGKKKEGIGFDAKTNLVTKVDILNSHITKYVNELLKIEMSDGTIVQSTKDHLWLLDNGKYVSASELKVGSKLKTVR